MTPAEVRSLVAAVLAGIAPEADLASVSEHEDLREALDLDSMDFMNLVIGLSQRSGRNIPEADTPKLFTLGGMLAYLAD
jgi:acyl carrier protein